MASQTTPSKLIDSMKYIKDTFTKYTGENGTMTKKILVKLFRNEFGMELSSKKQVEEIFNDLDADGDGVVTCAEFAKVVAEVIPEL